MQVRKGRRKPFGIMQIVHEGCRVKVLGSDRVLQARSSGMGASIEESVIWGERLFVELGAEKFSDE